MQGGQMRQARPAQPHVRAASNARPITGKTVIPSSSTYRHQSDECRPAKFSNKAGNLSFLIFCLSDIYFNSSAFSELYWS